MNVSRENAQSLIGTKVKFDDGVYKRPLRRRIVSGIILDLKYQKPYTQDYYWGPSREIPGHWRAEVQVGEVRHNLAVVYLKPA